MCQRSQVARGTERTLLIDHRQYVLVEHIDELLYRLQLHARISVRERLYLEQQDYLHYLFRYSFARAASVRHNEVLLKLREFLFAYRDITQ